MLFLFMMHNIYVSVILHIHKLDQYYIYINFHINKRHHPNLIKKPINIKPTTYDLSTDIKNYLLADMEKRKGATSIFGRSGIALRPIDELRDHGLRDRGFLVSLVFS